MPLQARPSPCVVGLLGLRKDHWTLWTPQGPKHSPHSDHDDQPQWTKVWPKPLMNLWCSCNILWATKGKWLTWAVWVGVAPLRLSPLTNTNLTINLNLLTRPIAHTCHLTHTLLWWHTLLGVAHHLTLWTPATLNGKKILLKRITLIIYNFYCLPNGTDLKSMVLRGHRLTRC